MNILDTLRSVITELDRVNVPVNMLEQIGVPLLNSSMQLKNLYNQIFTEEQKSSKVEEEEKTNEDEQQTV